MLKLGVLGASRIFRRVVVQPELVQVVAVASRSLERARFAVRDLPGARAVTGYDELLAADDVEAVYMALPPGLHATWAEKAAAAGKHVLVEKPLALAAQEVDRIEAAARGRNVTVLEAMPLDFHPWPTALAEPGPVQSLECRMSFGEPPEDSYRRTLSQGGGIFWDAAPYFAALVDLAFHRPQLVRVRSRGWGAISFESEVELDGGRRATLHCAFGGSHAAVVRATGPAGEVMHQSFLRPVTGAFRVNLHHIGTTGARRTISFPPSSYVETQLAAFLRACGRGFDQEAMGRARWRTALLEALWRAAEGAP